MTIGRWQIGAALSPHDRSWADPKRENARVARQCGLERIKRS